ncbi:hypothetical protein TSOC_001583 [Tetrabaena socialis]|uniref:Uncharacterized protein n=1 Tax=Tetrabaena socialis TaxID=47790 RepID=A0A2J8AG73_9CHLO|nr:hypothetical protein TSOC_001583 [Tetrabaena socialis]|eukprot:PNH11521.1 hypothetical protein TSOC_001583 [Tetrabaena socialis]
MSTLLAAQHPGLQVPGPKELLRHRIQERADHFVAACTAEDDVIRAFGRSKRGGGHGGRTFPPGVAR